MPLPEPVIGEAYRNSTAMSTLRDLVDVSTRMAGQEGEKEGARIVASALEEAGARDVGVEEFDLDGWWRGSSAVEVAGRRFGADHDVIALPGTPAGEVEAPLVDLGYALPEEIGSEADGAVVMARSDVPDDHDRWVHRLEKYAAAIENGAVGFLFRNHVEGCLPPTGEIGWGPRPGPIPAIGVSYEFGARLARHAEAGETARVEVDCRNEPTTSVNAEGVIGPDTDGEVWVTAHVDCHDIAEGARDNGVGSALVPEIGRLLSAVDLGTRVRLVTFGSEEVGLHGAHHLAATRDTGSIKCVLNIDGAGETRTPRLRSYGYGDVTAAFEDVTDALDVPLVVDDEPNPHTDAWEFAELGVPAVTAGSAKGDRGRGWGHTHADTLDKVDSRDLRDLAVVFAAAAAELADPGREIRGKSRAEFLETVPDHVERELSFYDRWTF